MTFALNKMAVWLSTLIVAGLMLFVSSAAQAHVAHGSGTSVTPPAFEVNVVLAFDADRSVRAVVLLAQDIDVPTDENATPAGEDRQNIDASCCGTGISSCASVALVQTAPALRRPVAIHAVSLIGVQYLTGTTVEGLIRPPRAAV